MILRWIWEFKSTPPSTEQAVEGFSRPFSSLLYCVSVVDVVRLFYQFPLPLLLGPATSLRLDFLLLLSGIPFLVLLLTWE